MHESSPQESHLYLSDVVDLCTRFPEKRFFTFIEKDSEPAYLTGKMLKNKMALLGSVLKKELSPRQKALIILPQGLDYIYCLLACWYANIVAIPIPVADRLHKEQDAENIGLILKDSRAECIITDNGCRAFIERQPSLRSNHLVNIDDLGENNSSDFLAEPCAPDDLSLLLYTSGSTSAPKGVMISNSDLMNQAKGHQWRIDRDSRIVTWLPQYHAFGLYYSILTPLLFGAESIIMSPGQVMQNPEMWFEAIDRYRGTHSGAPNFAFDLCCSNVDSRTVSKLSLESLKVLMCAGEPIRKQTCDNFLQKFQPIGLNPDAFCPLYGLSELCPVTSKSPQDPIRFISVDINSLEQKKLVFAEGENSKFVTSCGFVEDPTRALIVNPETRELTPSDEIGEIWLKSPAKASGYLNLPEETEKAFFGVVQGSGEKGFFRTGDLGFIDNNQLFIVGREKEVMIIHGKNHHPVDIESTIKKKVPGLSWPTAVFSTEGDNRERVIVVQEIEPFEDVKAYDRLVQSILGTVSKIHGLEIYEINFVEKGSTPLSVGLMKIQRKACRNLYIRKELKILYRYRQGVFGKPHNLEKAEQTAVEEENAIFRQIYEFVALFLQRELSAEKDRIEPDANIFDYGADSLKLMKLLQRIEKTFDIKITMKELYEVQTIRSLIEHIAGAIESDELMGSLKLKNNASTDLKSPLSENQKGLWALQKIEPNNSAYNAPVCFCIHKAVNVDAFEQALDFVLKRHPVLTSTISEENGIPCQTAQPPQPVHIQKADVSSLKPDEIVPYLKRIVKKPFVLDGDVLIRVNLLSRSETEYIILITVHHIVFDGISAAILINELLESYLCFEQNRLPAIPPVTESYYDFVEWEQRMMMDQKGKDCLSYWKNMLSGKLPVLEIPSQQPRSATTDFVGDVFSCKLLPELSEGVNAFAKSERVQQSVFFLSVFYLLLYQYNGQEDIVVGAPSMGRPKGHYESLIGYFANMMPLRVRLATSESFYDYVKRLQLVLADAIDHAEYPFSALVRELKNRRHMDGDGSVFQVAFFYQNYYQSANYMKIQQQYQDSLPLQFMDEIQQEGEYEFTLEVYEKENEFVFNVKYDSTIFDKSTISRMMDNYARLVEETLGNTSLSLGSYSSITKTEEKALLVDWNATRTSYPENRCFYELFREQAIRTPDEIAVAHENETLTYRALDEKSDILAAYLQHQGIAPNTLVGVYLERSMELIIGLLGILKAGGAYVPLDPEYPIDRINYMIDDSGMALILSQERLSSQAKELNQKKIYIDRKWDEITSLSKGVKIERYENQAKKLAYVIYTSGSTGNPKGVMIPHKALTNFLVSMKNNPGIEPSDKLLSVTTCSFDIAALELFLPLISGAQCRICGSDIVRDVEKLKQEIRSQKPTIMQATPVTWIMLFDSGWKNEERMKILCGGEAMPEKLKQVFIETDCDVWNMFGPTETTIWSTIQKIEKGSGPITIGKPIANTTIYILNKNLGPVPIGAHGELYIGGEGLSAGYVNLPKLSSEKFIENPFEPNTKLFATNDLARWLPNGNIEFLGRIDHQVKIRGFRIELGEVETQIRSYPGIKECVVVAKEHYGLNQLVAYYVSEPEPGEKLSALKIRDFLNKRLPEYMIPSLFMRLDKIPMTLNGKINRKALTDRKIEVAQKKNNSALVSDIEKKILAAWKEVLNNPNINVEDRFFDIGGNSFSAVVVAEKIKSMDYDFNVTKLFKYSNVKEIARHLAREKDDRDVSVRNSENIPPYRTAARAEARAPKDHFSFTYPDYYEDSTAIIGMSCRFPGAENYLEFWNNLKEGTENVRFCSPEELDGSGLPKEIVAHPDYVPVKSTVEKDTFDPEFFNLSPRDARYMDPQFRLLLLHSWKALEDAGYVPGQLPEASVFMSASNSYYQVFLPGFASATPGFMKNSDEYISWQLAQGGSIPTMISHKLGLKGPSLFVQSNCSSSLTGLYLAHQSIHAGESNYALVGGSTIFPTMNLGYVHKDGLNFSRDGHIKAFDAKADGMVGGEGVAVVVLKKASKAVKDRDHIYSLLRGISVNNDGADKAGFYAPSVNGQADVIRKTLEKTKIDPESISYIEAHGSGTKLGDSIELKALNEVFKERTAKKQFCGIGSVKTNIGHLDTVAGLAGCIKVALSLQYGIIPPSLNYTTPNPNIDLDDSPFYVTDKLTRWNGNKHSRIAALSSFGIGGTNVHAILQQHAGPRAANDTAALNPEGNETYLIPLSAKTIDQLKVYAEKLAAFIKTYLEPHQMEELAYTLQTGRKVMENRAVFVANSKDDLLQKMDDFINGNPDDRFFQREIETPDAIVDLFNENADCAELIRNWIKKKAFEKLATLWLRGVKIKWDYLYQESRPCKISLPTYPFKKQRYWITDKPTMLTGIENDGLPASSHSSVESSAPVLALPRKVRDSGKPAELVLKSTGSSSSVRISAPVETGRHMGPPPPSIVKEPVDRDNDRPTGRLIQNELRTSLATRLSLERDHIDIDESFVDMGLDSVVSAKWIDSINERYNASLNANNLDDYQNIRELANLLEGAAKPDAAVTVSQKKPHPKKSKGLMPGDSPEMKALQKELVETFAKALLMETEEVKADKNFVDMGMDSIVAVEWIDAINARYRLSIAATALYDYPTIRDLAHYIEQELNQEKKETAQQPSGFDGEHTLDEVLMLVEQGEMDVSHAEQLVKGGAL